MFKTKDLLKKQKKELLDLSNNIKRYMDKRESSYRFSYTIFDFYKFQKIAENIIAAIFGVNSNQYLKINSLSSLPKNDEGKVEEYVIKNMYGMLLGEIIGSKSALELIGRNKKYQVFISSTYQDLKDFRQAAYDIITSEGFFPAGMENFLASSQFPMQYIKRVIDNSDYYILIIGQRYGSIVPNTNISFTEMEYEYAKRNKKTIIPFIYLGNKTLTKASTEEDEIQKLNNFKNKVEKENVVMYFKTEMELKLKINQSLGEAINSHPSAGWIRLE